MKSVIITNIDDETHRYLRLHCFRHGLSMVHVIREEIEKMAKYEKGLREYVEDGNKEMVCYQCDYHWTSILVSGAPRKCPRCQSPYWSRPQHKVTPMIIQCDGKTYRVEYFCSTCEIAWPKDIETLNVSCPQCRRKCGASSRRVEVQDTPPTASDEQMSVEEFQDVWKKLREETVAGKEEEKHGESNESENI